MDRRRRSGRIMRTPKTVNRNKLFKHETPDTWQWRLYWKIKSIFNIIYKRPMNFIKKVLFYSKVLKKDFDFDSYGIYIILEAKLNRLLAALTGDQAMSELNKESLKALKESIKLCKILHKNDFEEKYYKIHDKKWGKLKTWSEPDMTRLDEKGKPLFYFYKSSRSKAKTIKQKQREKQDLLALMKQTEQGRLNTRLKLFELLHKNMDSWWD